MYPVVYCLCTLSDHGQFRAIADFLASFISLHSLQTRHPVFCSSFESSQTCHPSFKSVSHSLFARVFSFTSLQTLATAVWKFFFIPYRNSLCVLFNNIWGSVRRTSFPAPGTGLDVQCLAEFCLCDLLTLIQLCCVMSSERAGTGYRVEVILRLEERLKTTDFPAEALPMACIVWWIDGGVCVVDCEGSAGTDSGWDIDETNSWAGSRCHDNGRVSGR